MPAGEGGFAYDLVGEREGVLPVDLSFAAAVRESGDWRALDFAMPAGAVVPLQLDGLGAEVEFQAGRSGRARGDAAGMAGIPAG